MRYIANASSVPLNENKKSSTTPSIQSPMAAAPIAATIMSRSTLSCPFLSDAEALIAGPIPPAK